MITQAVIVENLLAYLNKKKTLPELVKWAEEAFVEVSESDKDLPDEAAVLDILGYIGAGDTPDFPLTWSILSDFLEQLGAKVRVIAE
jgi:hypothetical protein